MKLLVAICLILAAAAVCSDALKINADEKNKCLFLNATLQEFYASFADVFRMSDGSTIKVPETIQSRNMAQTAYIQELMHAVGVDVACATEQQNTDSTSLVCMKVCGTDLMNILLLAVVGNFVTNPGDPAISATAQSSSANAVPSVVRFPFHMQKSL